MIKTLLLSLILALASYAMFQPKAAAETMELAPSSHVVLKITNAMTLDELVRRAYPTGTGAGQRERIFVE